LWTLVSYVLSRHLRRDEVIHPLVELGKFRGEPVYSRSSVFSLKTAENWMRSGRKVKEGSQPMKWVKQRAATVNKQREIEVAMEMGRSGGEGIGQGAESSVMQGLYAKNQTELYKPGPVVNVSQILPRCMYFIMSPAIG
jgi:xeroderma pigmentosum group C-complementing protein